MAKIDVTSITGYADMTAEEKLAALEGLEIPESIDLKDFVKKDVFDKTASEAAKYKKDLQAKMSEDEVNKAKEAEEKEAVLKELEALRNEKFTSEYKASLLALGYDEKNAAESATALVGNDFTTFFGGLKKAFDGKEKALKTQLLQNTPEPPAGNGGSTITKEDFSKMSLSDKQKLATDNPETYKQLTGG